MQRLEAGTTSRGLSAVRFAGADSGSGRPRRSFVALWLFAAALLASASAAQEATKSKPEDAPTSPMPTTVNLWSGVAPGSEQWKQPEATLAHTSTCTTVRSS